MDIRTGEREDLQQMEEIESTCFRDGRFSRGVLKRLIAGREYLTLVAVQGESIVGYASAFRENADRWRLVSIATRPDRQEEGIGTTLLTAVQEHMVSQGVNELSLELGITNIPAFNLYLKFGFQLSGLIRDYYDDGEDALHMVLKP